MGDIDVLVCSAGVAGLNAPLIDYPIDEWKRVFEVDVHGLFYCNRLIARLMKTRGYGRKEGNPNASAYSAAKAAVIGLTKSLGKELVKDDVIVNAIAPAAIETPFFAGDAGLPRLRALEDSDGTFRHGRGSRGADLMVSEPRMLVLNRRSVRSRAAVPRIESLAGASSFVANASPIHHGRDTRAVRGICIATASYLFLATRALEFRLEPAEP